MFENVCRCCLSAKSTMISLYTDSTHNDGKSLEEYLNLLLNYTNREDLIYPTQVCLRCCKALQVSYHFILMSFKNKWKLQEISKVQGLFKQSNSNKGLGNPMTNENDMAIQVNIMQTGEDNYQVIIEGVQGQAVQQNTEETSTEQPLISNAKKETVLEPPSLKSYKCRHCPESFEFHNTLIDHTLSVHKYMIPFECVMCNFSTCHLESLSKHYKKLHQIQDVENRLYKTKELLTISAADKPIQDITFKCSQCDYQTHLHTDIDDHLSMEHDIEEDKDNFITTWHNCPSCYRQFSDKTAAKIHYTMAHNSPPVDDKPLHKCEKCGIAFDLKTSLVHHERICEIRDPVSCNFCKLQFSSVSKYEQHIKANHAVAIKHECEICEKSFQTSANLAAHRKRHNERHYQCELCPKNYINRSELQVHLRRIHKRPLPEHKRKVPTTRRSIQCEYCPFTSASKFTMEVHQYRHTGRPYKCKFCNKQFVLKNAIKQHCKKTHSFDIDDDELALMFKEKHGYPSRFDAFSERNNDLQIEEIDEVDMEVELQAFNLTLDDIMQDVFDNLKKGE